MPGITRINIMSDWQSWRLDLARAHEQQANAIYRRAFSQIGITIAQGDETISVTKQEAVSRYDWSEGIDVILSSNNGRMTLQEKFLTYDYDTVTFEERKTSGELGAWYYCTAQYYFVGYTRRYWDGRARQFYRNPVAEFQAWMLIDLPRLKRLDAMNAVTWQYNINKKDGRRASFRYFPFKSAPGSAVVARSAN